MPQRIDEKRLNELRAMQIDFSSDFQIKADSMENNEELVLEGFGVISSYKMLYHLVSVRIGCIP